MAANLDKSENALTNVTTVTYVRGIDASGNSVKISTANLASVLGVAGTANGTYYTGSTDFDLDNYKEIGTLAWPSGNNDKILNKPTTLLGRVRNTYFYNYGSILQEYLVADGVHYSRTFTSSWSAWSRADGFGFWSFSELINGMGVNSKDVPLSSAHYYYPPVRKPCFIVAIASDNSYHAALIYKFSEISGGAHNLVLWEVHSESTFLEFDENYGRVVQRAKSDDARTYSITLINLPWSV